MIDLQSLRPRDTSPAAIADALTRVQTAGRGLAAEINRLRAKHAGLLVVGTGEAVSAAELELKEASLSGERIMSLHAELERMLAAAPKPTPAEQLATAQTAAIAAVEKFGNWWLANRPVVENGMQLFTAGVVAIAALAEAQAAYVTAPSPNSNVVPLTPGAA